MADIVEKNAAPRNRPEHVTLDGRNGGSPSTSIPCWNAAWFSNASKLSMNRPPKLSLLAGEYTGENSLRGAFFRAPEGNDRKANGLPDDNDRQMLAP